MITRFETVTKHLVDPSGRKPPEAIHYKLETDEYKRHVKRGEYLKQRFHDMSKEEKFYSPNFLMLMQDWMEWQLKNNDILSD